MHKHHKAAQTQVGHLILAKYLALSQGRCPVRTVQGAARRMVKDIKHNDTALLFRTIINCKTPSSVEFSMNQIEHRWRDLNP